MSLPHFSHLRVFTSSGGNSYGWPLSSSSSAHRCGAGGAGKDVGPEVVPVSAGPVSGCTVAFAAVGAGSPAGWVTYPHQLQDNPSLGIPPFGTPRTVPQAVQLIVGRISRNAGGRVSW